MTIDAATAGFEIPLLIFAITALVLVALSDLYAILDARQDQAKARLQVAKRIDKDRPRDR